MFLDTKVAHKQAPLFIRVIILGLIIRSCFLIINYV
jgi:hypothetical protein